MINCCASQMIQSQWGRGKRKASAFGKTRVWTETRVFNGSSSDDSTEQKEGVKQKGISSTELVLVYWFWLQLVINLGWGGEGGFFSCGGIGGLCEVFVLTAIMHGVARDDHRWGHGDGSAPHGELVGDRIVSTAATGAGLTRSGSWIGNKAKQSTFTLRRLGQ